MAAPVPQANTPTPGDLSITGRLMEIRQMQADLRTRPVTGGFKFLKKLVYKAMRSAMWRQSNLNAATIDLVEAVYRELQQNPPQRVAASATKMKVAATPEVEASPAVAPAAKSNSSQVTFSTGEVLASCGMTQDQAKLNNIRILAGFNRVYSSPAEMRMPERVALYSLIFGMQPRNCLEIGTFRGGSSAIISGAMDDTGFGQLTCVDPMPKIAPELWAQISNRSRLFEGPSPDILTEVAKQVKSPFDFCLIDANHTYDAVKRDIVGVLPYLTDQAYILFHDANYPDVKRAIDESVAADDQLIDCGLVSIEPTVLNENGRTTTWAGLRLLRFKRRKAKAKAA